MQCTNFDIVVIDWHKLAQLLKTTAIAFYGHGPHLSALSRIGLILTLLRDELESNPSGQPLQNDNGLQIEHLRNLRIEAGKN